MPRFGFSLAIDAPPEAVLGLLADYEHWSSTFPATIRRARLIATDRVGDIVEVDHRWHGIIQNMVRWPSAHRVIIEEFKPGYGASFDLTAAWDAAGCQLDVVLDLCLHGWRAAFAPFAGPLARKRTCRYFLEPLKQAAERVVAKEIHS